MTTQTTNEAAEQIRLRHGHLRVTQHPPSPEASPMLTNVLDEALAVERRATVERIRERLTPYDLKGMGNTIWAILDEEAAR